MTLPTLTGMLPVAPTIFHENGGLDLDGQRNTTDFLIESESDGICILANYSEQFSLNDDERVAVIEATMERALGRTPVMVTTSHFSARIARERVIAAQERGASLVMMMAPFFGATMRVDEGTVLEYFKRVFDGIEIDLMIQDAPLSSTPVSVALLDRISQELPQLKYAKIEVSRTADKVRDLIATVGSAIPGLFDGEEAVTLIHDLEAGVVGSMSSGALPYELRGVVTDYLAGRHNEARNEWERLLPMIQYENRQLGLVATKVLLKEGRIIASECVRHPLTDVREEHRESYLAIARRADPLILRWAQNQ